MNAKRLCEITSRYAALRVVLVGDIALDRYLDIDPSLAEVSLETGLPVHNVTGVRPQPGGGGNVLACLAALRPGALAAVGCCGDDGEGLELRRALAALGADLTGFLVRPERMTFTYTKPLMVRPGSPPQELSRLDIRSRMPMDAALTGEIIGRLRAAAADADVIVAMDQAPESEAGVLPRRVKAALAALAGDWPAKVFLADSRTSIGDFTGVSIKANRAEVARQFGQTAEDADVEALAIRWSSELGRGVFVTLGEEGIVAAADGEARRVAGIPVDGPVDVTGAGDAVLAGIAVALAAGASPFEAAELGNLAGSIVVRKLGTTGTASIAELERAVTA